MNRDAIIGHTGFVGGILSQQHDFVEKFNTSNIDGLAGRQFDTLVCAAAPGSMFTANREPERDREQIDALIKSLDKVKTHCFVLISSIATLADVAAGHDERTLLFQNDLPYGRHRRALEIFCENRFSNCLTVRLPALFGPGLRKNLIFDLLNPVPSMLTKARIDSLLENLPLTLRDGLAQLYVSQTPGIYKINRGALNNDPRRPDMDAAVRATRMSATEFHNPDTTYQYYDLTRLWHDIQIATRFDLRRLHLVTEPLHARNIYLRLLGSEMPSNDARLHREDVRTRHASLWGRKCCFYLEDASDVLDKLERFFIAQRRVS